MKKALSLICVVFVFPVLLAGCARERPLPEDPHHHHTIEGFLLLDHDHHLHHVAAVRARANPLHGDDEHHEHEHGFSLAFTGFDENVLVVHVHHGHHHENDDDHHHDHHGSHHGEEGEGNLYFELEGAGRGWTAFTMWLLEEDQVLFISTPVLVIVGEEHEVEHP